MSMHRPSRAVVLVVIGIVLAACSATSPTPASPTSPAAGTLPPVVGGSVGTVTQSAESGIAAAGESAMTAPERTLSGAYKPLTGGTCEVLLNAASQALDVNVTLREEPFQDPQSNAAGIGCQISAVGTGQNFSSLAAVTLSIRSLLTNQGWTEDAAYSKNGTNSRAFAFRKNNGLVLANLEIKPSTDAQCPASQTVASCKLQPQQQQYTVMVRAAER